MSDMSGNDTPQPLGVYKCKELIHDILLQNGQKDLIMAHIRRKTTQQGWTWTMRDEFMDYIKKRGQDNVNVSHMIADLAPLGRELFPGDIRKELVETMVELAIPYFTLEESATPNIDPDNTQSEADKTFLYQSRDVKPDPGLGIGVEIADSPPPSPPMSASAASTPRQSPGPVVSSSTTTAASRQSPVQSTPRQSPAAAPRPIPAAAPRPLTPQPPPPPPVLRPETVSSTTKGDPVAQTEEEEEPEEEDEEEEEDARNNEDEDEDELMDV
ncbi:unnamed protein product [Orchesella dallaii]|uniref:Uncharacterized protein n=1 Tax=Orchesella dallaii TaxID=48710 RepID=A0ABP1Q249_9HEXA